MAEAPQVVLARWAVLSGDAAWSCDAGGTIRAFASDGRMWRFGAGLRDVLFELARGMPLTRLPSMARDLLEALQRAALVQITSAAPAGIQIAPVEQSDQQAAESAAVVGVGLLALVNAFVCLGLAGYSRDAIAQQLAHPWTWQGVAVGLSVTLLLTGLGVVLHEAAHAWMGRLSGLRATELCFFERRRLQPRYRVPNQSRWNDTHVRFRVFSAGPACDQVCVIALWVAALSLSNPALRLGLVMLSAAWLAVTSSNLVSRGHADMHLALSALDCGSARWQWLPLWARARRYYAGLVILAAGFWAVVWLHAAWELGS